jgi:hypothetical protein
MSLLFDDILATVPSPLSTVDEEDPMVHLRFFAPWNTWAWYAVEGEPDPPDNFHFYGWIVGWEDERTRVLSLEDTDESFRARGTYLTDTELEELVRDDGLEGFSLSTLQEIRGPGGRTVQRDRHFTPCRLSEVRRLYARGGPYEGQL